MFFFVSSHFDLIKPPRQVWNSLDVAGYSGVTTPSLKYFRFEIFVKVWDMDDCVRSIF